MGPLLMSDRIALARAIAARTKPRFIEIPRETVPFTEEQLSEMRGGLTAEEYRWKLIRQHSRKLCEQKQQGKKTRAMPAAITTISAYRLSTTG